MIVRYLETSALLAWLFNESDAESVINAINEADLIVTSELTRIETLRAVRRVRREGHLTSGQYEALLELFDESIKRWFRMNVDETIITGASEDFPVEPVRSLDSIHLATALEYKKLYPELEMLALDGRIRSNKEALLL